MKSNAFFWWRQHPLLCFILLANIFAWMIALPLGLLTLQNHAGWYWLHYLTAFAPAAAALVVVWLEQGGAAVWRFLLRLFTRPFSWWVALIALGLPLGLLAIAALWLGLGTGVWPDFALLGSVDYLPQLSLFWALLLWLATFGLGEEIGWRGFLLPRLRLRYGPLAASLVLGSIWALWHLPYFAYKAAYQSMGLGGIPLLFVSLLASAIVFTWLTELAKGNIIPAILFHAGFDAVTGSALGQGLIAAIMSAGVWIVAIAIAGWWQGRPGQRAASPWPEEIPASPD